MHVDVDVQSPAFKSYLFTRHVEEEMKGKKRNMKNIMGYIETLLSLIFHLRQRMSSKTLMKLVFIYALRTHRRQKIYILTGKMYLYNKIFSLLNQNGNSLARQERGTNLPNQHSMNCTSSTTMPLIFLQNFKSTHKAISAGNCISFFCELTRCIQTRYSLINNVRK